MNAPNDIRDLQRVTVNRLASVADRAAKVLKAVRSGIRAPSREKAAPVFSAKFVAEICGIDPQVLSRRLAKGDLPPGTSINKARREFRLEEIRQWARAYGMSAERMPGEKAFTVVTAIAKGGVAKTTTTMTLAQGLALRGYRVLAIDLDPQGSLTELCGFHPEGDIQDTQTALPMFVGSESSLRYAIRPTYWAGLDLVPASPALFGAEFALPGRQAKQKGGFSFWQVLDRSLDADGLRDEYDVVLIDTAPSMSYVTMNGIYAANGIVMPLPPQGLDFAASVQFLGLLSELADSLQDLAPEQPKQWDWFKVLLTKVKPQQSRDFEPPVMNFIAQAYGPFVMPLEVPESAVYTTTGTELSTVLDKASYDGSRESFKKARDAALRLVDHVEADIRMAWLSARQRSGAPTVTEDAREAA